MCYNFSIFSKTNQLSDLVFAERISQPDDMSRFDQCGSGDQATTQKTTPKSEEDNIDGKKVMIVDVDNFIDDLNPTTSATSSSEVAFTEVIKNANLTNFSSSPPTVTLERSEIIRDLQISTQKSLYTTSVPLETTKPGTSLKTTLFNTETSRIPSNFTDNRTSSDLSSTPEGHENKTQGQPIPQTITNNIGEPITNLTPAGLSTVQPITNSTTKSSSPIGSGFSKASKRKKVPPSSKLKTDKRVKSNTILATDVPTSVTRSGQEKVTGTTRNQTTLYPNYDTSLPFTTVQNYRVENRTTTSALWGMLKEVAYDTKRKSTLK